MTRPDIIATDHQPQPSPWQLYRAMVGVGLVCGLLIVGVYLATLETIAENRAAVLQRGIFRVLPGAVTYRSFKLKQTVYAGYDKNRQLVGLAVAAQGMGYQDVIRILYGYDPVRQLIVGMEVLESKETPGLGDKIEKDPVFIENFTALDVALAGDGSSLVHPLALVKPGQKTEAWQIDGISGATISSEAITNMLHTSTGRWVPQLYSRRDTFAWTGEVGDES
jgi:electron transport complex protein RnfG